MKILYATTNEYDEYNDGNNGTWFIATYVDVLAQHAHNLHFNEMLNIIDRTMERLCNDRLRDENADYIQEISWENLRFNKNLYFNPGYYESDNENGNDEGRGQE